MMENLTRRPALLRTEATRLLQNGLLDVLQQYGSPHVVGSYALDLMVWRDLDLQLVTDDLNLAQCFTLGGALASLLMPVRMHFRNEHIARTPGLPQGYYWGLYLGETAHGGWKIDVWATDRDQYAALCSAQDALRGTLTPEMRRAILEIKAVVWNHPGYRQTFTSQDVYHAVVQHGVTTVDEFWTFLRQKDA
ncbi:MAG: nitrous oxide reductase accessory protein NosL [Chloroflexota bacterium]|nr:nitrous oxide reductase accessory protein NosL [Chloroflexota bacterium]